jgi:hypothetical protein
MHRRNFLSFLPHLPFSDPAAPDSRWTPGAGAGQAKTDCDCTTFVTVPATKELARLSGKILLMTLRYACLILSRAPTKSRSEIIK